MSGKTLHFSLFAIWVFRLNDLKSAQILEDLLLDLQMFDDEFAVFE